MASRSDHLIGFYRAHGARYRVEVEIELAGGRLAISGTSGETRANGEFRTSYGDPIGGAAGQIIEELEQVDEFAAGWSAERRDQLAAIWRRWHLNDMRAGCEHQRAAGWGEKRIDESKPAGSYGRHFPGQRQDSWNLLGWIREDEHPDGLLSRACEVCGYRYGSAWLREELPADVVAFIEPLVST